jgi:hypothetical protein
MADQYKLDNIVTEVIEKFETRAQVGYQKYSATMDRDDLTIDQWLEHAQEEAMDFILYITKIRKELAGKSSCNCSINYL